MFHDVHCYPMKLFPPLLPLALTVLAVLAAGCSPKPDTGAAARAGYSGYAEADYLNLASPDAGRLQALYVRRGEHVAAGTPLFALEGKPPVTAPIEAEVAELGYNEGERVPAGQPVASLLAPQRVRARFYVPHDQVGALALGQPVQLACDACGDPIPATISFVARAPEPNRPGNVYLLEAKPDAPAPGLRPGQPLNVKPAGPASN
jgi:multidrug efflux pump subunit AcrA (membrane-fusion protein)